MYVCHHAGQVHMHVKYSMSKNTPLAVQQRKGSPDWTLRGGRVADRTTKQSPSAHASQSHTQGRKTTGCQALAVQDRFQVETMAKMPW